MTIWQASADWRQRHNSRDLVYRIRVRFESTAQADAVWQQLANNHRVDEEGAVLIGGSGIVRHSDTTFDLISGGEDALDSLEWCCNESLQQAMAAVAVAGVRVIAEERAIVTEPDRS